MRKESASAGPIRRHAPCNGGKWRWPSEAVLAALDVYIQEGGGSRGARAICDPTGELAPLTQDGALSEFRFLPERKQDRENRIFVRYEDGRFLRGPANSPARARTIRRLLSATGRAS